jgi:hypothetical protein
MDMNLAPTALLNFEEPSLRELTASRRWTALSERDRIRAIYDFVRDEVGFGYNEDDAIPASRVLSDGYGQCNTKGILFMALLRGIGIPCRFHGFTIDKALQKGAITGIWYALAPREIVHSWVEVYFEKKWINIEGFILDMPYLRAVQAKFPSARGGFCGYGIATDCFEAPAVEWTGGDTYIQKEGIKRDFGVYPSPDKFFAEHAQPIGPLKRFVYRTVTRHAMNARVAQIREGKKNA